MLNAISLPPTGRRIAALASMVAALVVIASGSARAALPIESFTGSVLDSAGQPATQAGGRPFEAKTSIRFPIGPDGTTAENLKTVVASLPPGFVGDPSATPKCEVGRSLNPADDNACPLSSQVGIATPLFSFGLPLLPAFPIYNIEPPPGVPARFGFRALYPDVVLDASVRPGDHGIDIISRNTSQALNLTGVDVTFWGVPGDPVHDGQRGLCATQGSGICPAELPRKPFLANPTDCSAGPLSTRLRVDSWREPGAFDSASFDHDVSFNPPVPMAVDNCELLEFDPTMEIQPTSTKAGSPTGLDVKLTTPQNTDPDGLASAHLKRVEVVLPEGMSVNPSAANGLGACSTTQIALGTDNPVGCPVSSRIGSVEIDTSLLPDPMTGDVYLAKQGDNPFGTLLALYVVARGPGVTIKLPGRVDADPVSGQLTTVFEDNPQLPFDALRLRLNGGDRAPLVNPSTCGEHKIVTRMSSWAAADPNGPTTEEQSVSHSAFEVTAGSDGGSCTARTFDPSFQAGMTDPGAGLSGTFSLTVARRNGESELKSITSIRLPQGLLGDVGSVPLCGGGQAATGGCPEESRIGHVQVAAGAGSSPLWVPQLGKEPTGVYLTGPYRGAPFGLSIKVPAQAGPFDLGKVVVRSALYLDEQTAQISSGVDETRLLDIDGNVTEILPEALPRILEGVVLNQREIRVIVDRKDFMVNPTDCSQQRITASLHSFGGHRVDVGNGFRAADCATLGFKPGFRAKILDKGRKSTRRSWHPRTRFTVSPRSGDANIDGARVALPSSTLLDQANIGTTCTRAQMAGRNCPEASKVGYARAWSPLLREVVEGPVYLAANGGVRPLPDLAAVLDGEIRVVLRGEVSTLRSGGRARLQNTFRVVPDAPVERFVLTMRGGRKRGLLVNSTDLCRTAERGVAVFRGQNGRIHRLRPRIATAFKGCGKVRRQAKREASRKKAAARE